MVTYLHTHTCELAAAVFRTIFAQPDPPRWPAAGRHRRTSSGDRFPKVETIADGRRQDQVLAFADFPPAHWKKIWSTNPLERVNKEIPVLNLACPAGATVPA